MTTKQDSPAPSRSTVARIGFGVRRKDGIGAIGIKGKASAASVRGGRRTQAEDRADQGGEPEHEGKCDPGEHESLPGMKKPAGARGRRGRLRFGRSSEHHLRPPVYHMFSNKSSLDAGAAERSPRNCLRRNGPSRPTRANHDRLHP